MNAPHRVRRIAGLAAIVVVSSPLFGSGCTPATAPKTEAGASEPAKAATSRGGGVDRDEPSGVELQLEESLAGMPAVALALTCVTWADGVSPGGGRDLLVKAGSDSFVAAELDQFRRLLAASELSAEFSRLVASDFGMARALLSGFDRHGLWKHFPALGGLRETWSTQLEGARQGLVRRRPRARELFIGVSPYGMQGLDTLTGNSVVLIADARAISLYGVPEGPIRALQPISEEDVLIVSGGGTRPGSGAIVPPLLLGDLRVTRLHLPDLSVREGIVRVDEAHAVHIDLSAEEALVVLRDNDDERTRRGRCRLDGTTCDRFDPVSLTPPVAGVEITAYTSYDPLDRPPGGPPPGLVGRQTQVSPDGRFTAMVTQCATESTTASDAVHRALSVGAPASEASVVAEGWGWFHARWLDERRLAFDLDPRVRAPDLRQALRREYLELSEGGYEDWRPPPHGADRSAIELVTMFLRTREEPARRPLLWNAVDQRVGVLDVETRKVTILPWPHLRVRSSFTVPPLSEAHGHFLEVAPAGTDAYAASNRGSWRCMGPPDHPLGICTAAKMKPGLTARPGAARPPRPRSPRSAARRLRRRAGTRGAPAG